MQHMEKQSQAALILVDVQNDYFPGGRMVLPGAVKAGTHAAQLLQHWRKNRMPVAHVQHVATQPGAKFFLPNTEGMEIRAEVSPLDGEAVFIKNYPSSFRATGLEASLRQWGISRLVVAGMMSQMCVDTTVRAAFDLGFECVVAHDACAAAPLQFEGMSLQAEQVHAAYMAALGAVFARVVTTGELIEGS